MKTTDFVSWLVSAKALVNKVSAVLLLAGIVLSIVVSVWWWIFIIAVILITLVVNSLCIVMPGNAGYLIVLGNLVNKPIPAGLRCVVPFISNVTEVDIRLQKHEDANTMKTANLRDITLKYALTYQVDNELVHLLHSTIGENHYVETALCPWLDAVMTQVVASKTYEDINGKLGDLSQEIESAYLAKVEAQCINIAGQNLFKNMSVAITDVKFDEEYTKAVSDLAKAQKEKEIVEAKAVQLKISTEAQAEALRITAQAEADALKLKGASENEVKEKLGRILNKHPELLKEMLAKNFPKVFGGGGVTPMIDLDQLLGK